MPSIEQLLEEGSKEIVRGHIRKIVEIYDLEWIVTHELVQNAIDAIQSNPRVDHGTVQLILDFDNNTVSVRDNGTGFENDLGLLRPGGTGSEKRLSSRSPAKGYQGVGLKAVMYSTREFELVSQTPNEEWTFLSQGLRQYIDPEVEANPEYETEVLKQDSKNTYTEITATFPDGWLNDFVIAVERHLGKDSDKWKALYESERPKNGEDPYSAYLSHFWGWYFRTQSYVGCVNGLLNVPVQNPDTGELEAMKPIEIAMTLRSSKEFVGVPGQLGGWLQGLQETEYMTSFPYKAWDFAEVALENEKQSAKYRIVPQLVQIKPNDPTWEDLSVSFRDKFLDLKLTPNEKAEDFRERYADLIAILERPRSRVRAEDFEDVLRRVTGIYLAIGRTSHFETLGVPNRGLKLIASNGTPTAHELTVRSTSSTWYMETIHFVVNVDATLNIGKRHMVNTWLVGRLRELFEACYPSLVAISKLFVERDPDGGDGEPPMPDVIDLSRLSRQGLSFRRFPADESTLVGLFSTAMSLLDPDFSVYGFFGKARYDGKFLWDRTEPRSDVELKRLEFKLSLQKLVDEFDLATHDKEFRDVSLVVVWDRTVTKSGWSVKGISPPRRTQLDNMGVPTDLIEHVLEDRLGMFRPLICVADLLAKVPLEESTEDDLNEYVRSMK